jgi:hypothetical protein
MEENARKDGRPESWTAFADLKAGKGSYVLAVLGHINAAILHEHAGGKDSAGSSYQRAFEVCRKGKCRDLAVIVMDRWAQMLEEAGDLPGSALVYERLGAFCEEHEAVFLAADAFEHAAEMLKKSGRDVSGYAKPIELWERNARQWDEQGHPDDALWSRRHIDLYRELVRG